MIKIARQKFPIAAPGANCFRGRAEESVGNEDWLRGVWKDWKVEAGGSSGENEGEGQTKARQRRSEESDDGQVKVSVENRKATKFIIIIIIIR